MPGIQSRGRTRNNTNKIEQVKTQNKVIVTKPRTTTYQPRPASGQLDQSTQNKIQPTASNIEQATIVKKAKRKHPKKLIHGSKQINTPGLTPLGKFGLGIYNTGSDYANILNTDYEDRSVLNQAIGHVFEGKWDKAGQVIQNNPYRFAGNLAVEVASNLIPLGAIAKAAKVAKYTNKALNTAKKVIPKKKIDGEQTETLYKIVDASTGKSFWYSKVPHSFYHDKVAHGMSKGIGGELYGSVPQIRAVEVPKSVYKQFRVSNIIKTGKVESTIIHKTKSGFKSLTKKTTFAATPRHEINRLRSLGKTAVDEGQTKLNKIGEHRASEFLTKHTPKNSPNMPDVIMDIKNTGMGEKIGAKLKLESFDPLNEWALKHRWQKAEKVIATAGQKESRIKRLFDSTLSKDKYQNKIAQIYKSKGYKKTIKDNSGQVFDEGTTPLAFNRANEQMKLINTVPTVMLSFVPITVSTVSKAKAAIKGTGRRFNQDQSFGGYGQFI